MKKALFIEKLVSLTKSRELAEAVLAFIEDWQKQEAEHKKECQKKGIKEAKEQGVTFGRPKIKEPENFNCICDRYLDGQITAASAALLCNMGVSTFYRRVRGYETQKEMRGNIENEKI